MDEIIELMGLAAYRDKFVSELSTGTRCIVDFACTLAHEPKVTLLDEPSSGIAQRETEALGPLLMRVKEATGATLLVIEHDMPLLTSIADEIIALDLGKVVAQGLPQEVLRHEAVVTSYLGSAQGVHPEGNGSPPKRTPRNRRSSAAAPAGKSLAQEEEKPGGGIRLTGGEQVSRARRPSRSRRPRG